MIIYKTNENTFTIYNNGDKYLVEKNLDLSKWEVSKINKCNMSWDNQGIWIDWISVELNDSDLELEIRKVITAN